MRIKILIIALALVLLPVARAQQIPQTIDEFRRKVFRFTNKPPGLYELNVGIVDTNSWVAAFGDFSQTGYTGIILADRPGKVLTLLKWADKNSSKNLDRGTSWYRKARRLVGPYGNEDDSYTCS